MPEPTDIKYLLISILIPAFNEQDTIVAVLERIATVKVPGVSFETVVIDDGSTDNTRRILEENNTLYARLIARDINGGKGAAVRDGLSVALSLIHI